MMDNNISAITRLKGHCVYANMYIWGKFLYYTESMEQLEYKINPLDSGQTISQQCYILLGVT